MKLNKLSIKKDDFYKIAKNAFIIAFFFLFLIEFNIWKLSGSSLDSIPDGKGFPYYWFEYCGRYPCADVNWFVIISAFTIDVLFWFLVSFPIGWVLHIFGIDINFTNWKIERQVPK